MNEETFFALLRLHKFFLDQNITLPHDILLDHKTVLDWMDKYQKEMPDS
jgi:hypothetical protein